MADGTVLSTNVGTGDTIATDDLGAFGKVQWVKLVDGTNGGTALIGGDATNGLDVDVTRLPSLPAGTNAIGKLAANSGVDIGDVDVTSVPGTAADGAAGLPSVTYVLAGYDGTNVQALVTDSTGRLILPPTSQAGATVKTSDYDSGAGADTVAMQGIALPASGGAVQGGTSTNPVRTDPTGTTTQPVSDGGGSLTVDGTVAVSGTVAVTDNAGSLTVDNGGTFAVQIAANSSVNQAQVAGTATDTNSGVKSAGTQRVVLATDQPQLTNALKVDGSAVTQPVSGTVTANLGTAAVTNAGTFAVQDSEKIADDAAFGVASTKLTPVGYLADQASTDSVNEGDIGAARITLDRKQIMTMAPSADTEGLSTFHLVSAASTNATSVKASEGKLHGWFIYNSNAAARKVAFHNTAGTPTAGASVHSSIVIPPTSAANAFSEIGVKFATGIGITTVTDLTDAGATAVALNDLNINLYYT